MCTRASVWQHPLVYLNSASTCKPITMTNNNNRKPTLRILLAHIHGCERDNALQDTHSVISLFLTHLTHSNRAQDNRLSHPLATHRRTYLRRLRTAISLRHLPIVRSAWLTHFRVGNSLKYQSPCCDSVSRWLLVVTLIAQTQACARETRFLKNKNATCASQRCC